jgi:hypothetical protein
MTGFWYLATPYSRYPYGTEAAFRGAVDAAAICIRSGVMVFSPIAHSHPIAVSGQIAGHFEQWAELDEAMIRASNGMIVVEMEGWKDSAGIKAEIDLCHCFGKAVYFMSPNGPAPLVTKSTK